MPFQNALSRKWYRRLKPTLTHLELHQDEDGRLFAEFKIVGHSPKKKTKEIVELTSSELDQLQLIQARTTDDGRFHLCPRPELIQVRISK